MYVLAINASPNENGNTAFLLDEILNNITEIDIEKKRIDLQKAVSKLSNPFCTCCMPQCTGVCYKGTDFEKVFEEMTRADVIIFGSPVYFGAPTAQLKVLFDKSRAYRKRNAFLGKYAAAVTVGGSQYGGQETTMRTIHDMALVEGMMLVGDGSTEFDSGHFGVCAHRPSREDETAILRCRVLASRITNILKG